MIGENDNQAILHNLQHIRQNDKSNSIQSELDIIHDCKPESNSMRHLTESRLNDNSGESIFQNISKNDLFRTFSAYGGGFNKSISKIIKLTPF